MIREKKGEKVIILKYSFSRGLAGMWTLCNDGNHSRGAGTWRTHVLERVCTTSNHLRAGRWPVKPQHLQWLGSGAMQSKAGEDCLPLCPPYGCISTNKSIFS